MESDRLHRVLHIDLTQCRHRVEDRDDLFQESIGGISIASSLLEEECPKGIDPLAPENPIIFALGPLTGLFPLASKMVAMFKSPLTGNLGESHAGGRSAVSLRLAGYGAMVITGASQSPVYVVIHGDRVYFRDASALWRLRDSHTVGRIIREREGGSGTRSIMRIGRAGENLVRYASVITETYRHFGRLGLGAVFGSKKLKAVVVSGNCSIEVSDPKQYRRTYDEIFEAAVSSPAMKKYHQIGTAENIESLNAIGGLPTTNLQQSRFDNAEAISGEHIAAQYLGRRIACAHCPIACIHLAALREPYEAEPYFYKTSMISYDYEPIYAMGTMLGIGDGRGLLKLLDDAERHGIDVMSGGVALAWATEALQKGLVNSKDLNDIELNWGDWRTYQQALGEIVIQRNDFYRALARGVQYASSKYGGADFALTFGGNEMPGYHTGPASYAGFLLGSRHSHLDSAGYSIDQKCLAEKRMLAPADIAEALIAEESWRQVLSSAAVCYFARGVYNEERIAKAFSIAGRQVSLDTLRRIGEQTLGRKYAFKLREGFSHRNLRIPQRILETPSPSGMIKEDSLREIMDHMHKKLLSLGSH